MLARIHGKTIEISDERLRGSVETHALKAGGKNHSTASGCPKVENRKVPSGSTARDMETGAVPVPVTNPAPSIYRSKLESAFARTLEFDRLAGMIAGWAYEPVRFRLPGEKNFYKADFFSWGHADDPRPVVHEIKGHNKSDDRSLVKLKTAAGLNPWAKFILWKYIRGAWVERVIE